MMKKIVSLILAVSSFLAISGILSGCTDNAENHQKPTPDSGGKEISGNVLFIETDENDSVGSKLKAKLSDMGCTVTESTFGELTEKGLDTTGIDLVVNAAGSLYVSDTMPALSEYINKGGALMTLGGAPFTERYYLSGGRYVTADDIIENGDVIEDFDDESVLDRITSDTDNTGSFKTTLTIEDTGSGYGNGLTVSIGIYRKKNMHTMELDLSGHNAIAMRMTQNNNCYSTLFVATDKNGAVWYAVSGSVTRVEEWESYVLAAKDFVRADGTEGALDFDNVATLGFGFDKDIYGNCYSSPNVFFRIDRIVGFDLESENYGPLDMYTYIRNVPNVPPLVFLSDYYFIYGRNEISSVIPTFGGDVMNISGSAYTLTHEFAEMGNGYSRMTGILSAADSADKAAKAPYAAWLGIRDNGAPIAVFGIEDERFYSAEAGVELMASTAEKILSGNYITEAPNGLEIYSDSLMASVSAKAKGDAEIKITAGTVSSEGASGTASLEFAGEPDSTLPVTVTLERDGKVLDRTSFDVSFHAGKKTVRVVCVGDSLTESNGASEGNTYPEQLGRINGPYEIESYGFGIGEATCLKRYGRVYRNIPSLWDGSHEVESDYVVILFANNEAGIWDTAKSVFYDDYTDFGKTYADLPWHPQVILCLPIPRLSGHNVIKTTEDEVWPLIEKVAEDNGWATVNMYDYLDGKSYLMGEPIHPNDFGYGAMAHAVYDKIAELEDAKASAQD